MKTFIIILCLLSQVSIAVSQDVKTKKELRKEASLKKKEAKEAKLQQQFKATETLLNSRNFVLNANTKTTHSGLQRDADGGLNFISVNSDNIVTQTGSNSGKGYNDIGGVTLKGKITKWDLLKNDKNKSFNLHLEITSDLGGWPYDINIDVSADGRSSVTIGGSKLFDGNLVERDYAHIYTGDSYFVY
jgi:hypothetical protein